MYGEQFGVSTENLQLGQLSNYLSENSRIFDFKLRVFDERVND